MKGLELCEQYFRQCGLPALEAECGQHVSKMAIGLVGDGSECLGFDDEHSRDHDWGPGFCIWLTKEDFVEIGPEIQKVYESLPKSFAGFEARMTSQWGDGRVGVLEMGSFYQRYLGSPGAPETLSQWLVIPENALAMATNGKVFHDPKGSFTAIRNSLLDCYPEDVRLKKLAAQCMSAGREGQYNYPRCLKRNELYAAAQAEMQFLKSALSIVFLLNKTYLPFYKWAHRAVKVLPILGNDSYDAIAELMEMNSPKDKEIRLESFAKKIIAQLKELGLSEGESDFLPDHGPLIQECIRDEEMRSYSVWMG